MRIGNYLFLIWRRSRQRLFETLLIIVAIAVGTALLTFVLGLFGGIDLFLQEMDEEILTVVPVKFSMNDFFSGGTMIPLLPLEDFADEEVKLTLVDFFTLKEELEEEALVYTYTRGMFQDDEIPFAYVALTPEFFTAMELEIESGSLLTSADVADNSYNVVLGKELASLLFPDEDPLGQTLRTDLLPDLQIIGILKDYQKQDKLVSGFGTGDEFNRLAYIPFSLMHILKDYTALFSGVFPTEAYSPDKVIIDQIMVKTYGGKEQVPYLKRRMEEFFLPTYGKGVTVREPASYAAVFGASKDMVLAIGGAATIALIVAALNIMNLMMARVVARTKSISLNIALGANRPIIFMQLFVEVLFLGLVGGVLGVVMTKLYIAFSVNLMPHSPMIFSIKTALIGISVAIFLALTFGIYPALQATRIVPADALRAE